MRRGSSAAVLLWVAVAATVAFFAGQAAAPESALYSRLLSARAIGWIGALPKATFLALAAVVGWRVGGRFGARNPSATAWRFYGVALGMLFLGQAVLTWYMARGAGTVFPSIGDLFFVAGSLLLVGALVAFLRAYAASGFPLAPAGQLWTVGVVATLLGAAVVVPLLRPLLAAAAPPLEKALNVAYPTLDFLMLVPAALLLWMGLRFRGGHVARVATALVAGVLFTTVADVLFGYFSSLDRVDLGAAVDALYLLAYGCLAAAPLYQSELLDG